MKTAGDKIVRIGVDTGGTFTDVAVLGRSGLLRVLKVRSTPADPSRAVLEGLRRLGLLRSTSAIIIHGTTVATNAFLQRRGGKAALVATQGFEDVLVLGRQARPGLYALDPPERQEWIPSRLRLGLEERTGPSGERLIPLESRSLRRLLRHLQARRPEAVAVCLLHAYANPAHERRVGAALRRRGWHVSLSHQVSGEFREFERTSTTVANAVLARPVDGYLAALQRRLGRRLRIMGSSGGWMTSGRARAMPVRTLLSGPAGGALAAARLGRRLGAPRLITLDMGGTSTDLALCLGQVPRVPRTSLEGTPLLLPTLDIRSLGSGGGSIARRDAGGGLRVGPESAGADPGPACYGRGGSEPTLTDALLVLGRLPAAGLLGGAMPLSRAAAVEALRRLGRSLRMGVAQTARGILEVVETHLENAIRALVAERGLAPDAFQLLVFGGAGGLVACGVAQRLGIRRILVPPDPGTLSALGLAASPAAWEGSRTLLHSGRSFTREQMRRWSEPLVRQGVRTLRREQAGRAPIEIVREADFRYRGQSHEITVPAGAGAVERFHREHQRRFGYARRGEVVELVTVRVRVQGKEVAAAGHGPRGPGAARRVAAGGGREIARQDLHPGTRVTGPALITEYSATTYLARGFRLEVGAAGELVLGRRGGK
jgi:N-methylhydantoinase A